MPVLCHLTTVLFNTGSFRVCLKLEISRNNYPGILTIQQENIRGCCLLEMLRTLLATYVLRQHFLLNPQKFIIPFRLRDNLQKIDHTFFHCMKYLH